MEETRRVRRERIYPFRNLRRSALLGEWYIIRILEDSSISSDGYEIKNDDGMHKCIPYEQTNGFTILQTWLIIGTGGTHKCVPYEQTNGFTILQTWLIIGTSGTHKCVPYEQTNGFTILQTWLIIGTGGTHKCIPYEQTNGFTILQTWLIIGTGGTHKCVPYEQTNGFTILQTWSIIGTSGTHKCVPYEQNLYQSAMVQTKEQSSGLGWLLLGFFFASVLLCVGLSFRKPKEKTVPLFGRYGRFFYSRLSTTVSSSSLQASSCC